MDFLKHLRNQMTKSLGKKKKKRTLSAISTSSNCSISPCWPPRRHIAERLRSTPWLFGPNSGEGQEKRFLDSKIKVEKVQMKVEMKVNILSKKESVFVFFGLEGIGLSRWLPPSGQQQFEISIARVQDPQRWSRWMDLNDLKCCCHLWLTATWALKQHGVGPDLGRSSKFGVFKWNI